MERISSKTIKGEALLKLEDLLGGEGKTVELLNPLETSLYKTQLSYLDSEDISKEILARSVEKFEIESSEYFLHINYLGLDVLNSEEHGIIRLEYLDREFFDEEESSYSGETTHASVKKGCGFPVTISRKKLSDLHLKIENLNRRKAEIKVYRLYSHTGGQNYKFETFMKDRGKSIELLNPLETPFYKSPFYKSQHSYLEFPRTTKEVETMSREKLEIEFDKYFLTINYLGLDFNNEEQGIVKVKYRGKEDILDGKPGYAYVKKGSIRPIAPFKKGLLKDIFLEIEYLDREKAKIKIYPTKP